MLRRAKRADKVRRTAKLQSTTPYFGPVKNATPAGVQDTELDGDYSSDVYKRHERSLVTRFERLPSTCHNRAQNGHCSLYINSFSGG